VKLPPMHLVGLNDKTRKRQLQHGTCFEQAVLHHTLTARYSTWVWIRFVNTSWQTACHHWRAI